MPLSNSLCFSTQPAHGVVGMLWIGTLLISSCITVTKKVEYIISNSQMYFRNIPIDYHDL